ncbi:glycosyltransferase [Massilia sp. SR12]
MPRVAVITATHNSAAFIEHTVRSVLQQTMADLEYIVVDDGSTDGTQALLQELAAGDARLRLVLRATASGGPTVPKNTALAMVRAPYVCFLDHDDYYAPTRLERLADGLDRQPDWVAAFHDVELVDGALQAQPGSYLKRVGFPARAGSALQAQGQGWYHCGPAFYNFMCLHYGALHTVSVMLAPGRMAAGLLAYRAEFKGCDDTDLWLRVARQGSIGYLDEILSSYRLHGANLSGDTVTMTANAVRVHQDNWQYARTRLAPAELARYRRKIVQYQLDLAYQLSEQRRDREACAVYRQVLRGGTWLAPLQRMARLGLKRALGHGAR